MIYEYNAKVVNTNKLDDFYQKQNFVGYLLPDGTVFSCKNHNEEDADTFLKMGLSLMKINYDEKDLFLNEKTNNPLVKIIQNYLKKVSYEECLALAKFIREYICQLVTY